MCVVALESNSSNHADSTFFDYSNVGLNSNLHFNLRISTFPLQPNVFLSNACLRESLGAPAWSHFLLADKVGPIMGVRSMVLLAIALFVRGTMTNNRTEVDMSDLTGIHDGFVTKVAKNMGASFGTLYTTSPF